MQKPKLILGTANFGPRAYGLQTEPLSLVEIKFILEHAKQYGIKILEGSELYECDELLRDPLFDLIYKVKHPYNLSRALERTGRGSLLGLLYHHSENTRATTYFDHDRYVQYFGASVYSHKQLLGTEMMVEVPLNLENKTFEAFTAPCKIVRSVFGRGELLKKYSVKDCLDYVKSVNNIHGVIIGVNSVKDLDEIIKVW